MGKRIVILVVGFMFIVVGQSGALRYQHGSAVPADAADRTGTVRGAVKDIRLDSTHDDFASFAFVADNLCHRAPGCDSVSMVDLGRAELVERGEHMWCSPGRLVGSPGRRIVISQPSNFDYTPARPRVRWIQLYRYRPASSDTWQEDDVELAMMPKQTLAVSGGIGMSPSGDRIFVSVDGGQRNPSLPSDVRGVASYDVDLSDLSGPWPQRGFLQLNGVPYEILTGRDGRLAHVVTHDPPQLHTIDLNSMQESGPMVDLQNVVTQLPLAGSLSDLHAALSPDDRYVLLNDVTGFTSPGHLVAVDLVSRQWHSVQGLKRITNGTVYDLALNHAVENHGLLAVHHGVAVGIYRFEPPDQVVGLAFTSIKSPAAHGNAITGSIAWDYDGTRIIATSSGREGFVVFSVENAGLDLQRIDIVKPCSIGNQIPDAILTFNHWLEPPTPTPTVRPSATSTSTSVPTATPTPQSTATSSPTETASPTPTATTEPVPIYLPFVADQHCRTRQERADVMVVLDTSSSMKGHKLADARAAAVVFVELLDLSPDGDQVGIVRFDSEAELVHALSSEREAATRAIRDLESREGTHIDKGLRVALAELQSERRNEENRAVVILLTDGIQTGEPGAELEAAAEVRRAGVRLYTVGLGGDVDGATLKVMAGDPRRYYFAPDSTDLEAIYREIARDIACVPD